MATRTLPIDRQHRHGLATVKWSVIFDGDTTYTPLDLELRPGVLPMEYLDARGIQRDTYVVFKPARVG